VIIAPAGAVSTTAVPAAGYVRSSFGASSGSALTVAALPTLSPPAISAGKPFLEEFPIRLYAELTQVRRLADGLDVRVRLTAQYSTADLAGLLGGRGSPGTSGSLTQQVPSALREYEPPTRETGPRTIYPPRTGATTLLDVTGLGVDLNPAPALPNIGITVDFRWGP
jgi:hypothetical protein